MPRSEAHNPSPPSLAERAETQALALEDLHAVRSRQLVLRGINVAVHPGEVVSIYGPRGTGKSTLVACVAGLVPPTRGLVRILGSPLGEAHRELLGRLGLVLAARGTDDDLSALANLVLAARLHGLFAVPARAAARELLTLVDFDDSGIDEQAGRLSSHQRARLELARALMHEPSVLVLDSPTAGLGAASGARYWGRLASLCSARHIAVLVATDDPYEAAFAHRVHFLDGGRVAAEDTPEALMAQAGAEVITIHTHDPAGLARTLASQLDLAAECGPDAVVVRQTGGRDLVTRLLARLPAEQWREISLRPPNLADAYRVLTGRTGLASAAGGEPC